MNVKAQPSFTMIILTFFYITMTHHYTLDSAQRVAKFLASNPRRPCMKTIIIILLVFANLTIGQTLFGGGEANPDVLTNKESLQKWQKMRFGMFIHWGPVALRGTEIGWSRANQVPADEYDQLYKKFNPVQFNADEWMALAKTAGMNYLIFVTKHHDGFSLWDTDYSEYDIMATPFKRDIVKELSDACKKHDLLFGTYYSILDWYHPDYPIELIKGKRTPKENADMQKYIPFLKGQLRELVQEYGTQILWFDGEWEEPWTHEMGMDLYVYGRGLNDDILINNRVDKGREGMDGVSKGAQFAGDFETPEQRVGTFNTETPWESCITIGRQWAWKPNDTLKSAKECIHLLLQTVGGDGNLLLNISPKPDGSIEQRQIDVLTEIGAWMDTYGETIYGTRGGPIPPQKWGVTTQKADKIFVHVMAAKATSILLPHFSQPIKSAKLFVDGSPVKTKVTNKGLVIELDNKVTHNIDHVIEIER